MIKQFKLAATLFITAICSCGNNDTDVVTNYRDTTNEIDSTGASEINDTSYWTKKGNRVYQDSIIDSWSYGSIHLGEVVRQYCNIAIDIDSDEYRHFNILKRATIKNDRMEYYRLIVGDKYLYVDADSNMVITDSAKAISVLLKAMLWEFEKNYIKYNK